MAKLKRLVLSAVQHFIDSGHYPFWECAVGMRRKPGSVCVVRWGAHRYLTQFITLSVVINYSKSRIGLRLISVDAQNTTQSPILCDLDSTFYFTHSANFLSITFTYMLPYQSLTSCLSKRLPSTRNINNRSAHHHQTPNLRLHAHRGTPHQQTPNLRLHAHRSAPHQQQKPTILPLDHHLKSPNLP